MREPDPIINQNDHLIKHYLCSVCWGSLHILHGEVVCRKYGTEHEGFVSKHYVENERAKDKSRRREAAWNLRSMFPKKSESELLSELGFEEEQ